MARKKEKKKPREMKTRIRSPYPMATQMRTQMGPIGCQDRVTANDQPLMSLTNVNR